MKIWSWILNSIRSFLEKTQKLERDGWNYSKSGRNKWNIVGQPFYHPKEVFFSTFFVDFEIIEILWYQKKGFLFGIFLYWTRQYFKSWPDVGHSSYSSGELPEIPNPSPVKRDRRSLDGNCTNTRRDEGNSLFFNFIANVFWYLLHHWYQGTIHNYSRTNSNSQSPIHENYPLTNHSRTESPVHHHSQTIPFMKDLFTNPSIHSQIAYSRTTTSSWTTYSTNELFTCFSFKFQILGLSWTQKNRRISTSHAISDQNSLFPKV